MKKFLLLLTSCGGITEPLGDHPNRCFWYAEQGYPGFSLDTLGWVTRRDGTTAPILACGSRGVRVTG
jgi:hypothetical protein